MGEVWLAEREGADFQQRVAIKLLPWSGNVAAAARFRRERRILARLSHPNIAKLLDGGLTPAGHPWLAMEFVAGTHLIEHCATKGLGVEARLRLFANVCDAVQFAHQNLVVHRDLKPGNVLVGDTGEPKLLDFGIAKLLEGGSDDGVNTHVDERPMTLEYAAPEQIRGELITTSTDVWALGVILCELLTGGRPFTGNSRADVEAAILAADPPRPSTRIDISQLGAGESLRDRRRKLRGDLDAITLKALRPEPSHRYPSAGELAADIRRHLAGAPVTARGDATSYLLRTLVKRYRTPVALASILLLALVLGLAATLWQNRRAREEARRAELAQDFLVSMLQSFDPRSTSGQPLTQSDILAKGETRLDELANEPEVQARLLRAFTQTWYDLGDYQRARAAAERALGIERGLAPRSAGIAGTLLQLGEIRFELGEYPESERLLQEALLMAREVEGPRGETVRRALNDLAGVKRRLNSFGEAERLRREALALYLATRGQRDPETLGVMNDLAVLLGDEGHFAESAELQEQTCKLMEAVNGKEHVDTLVCWNNLGRDLLELGRAKEAETISARVQAAQVAIFGTESGDLAYAENVHARAMDALGNPEQALQLFEDAVRRATREFGAEHGLVASLLSYESSALRHAGRLAEAEQVARRALAISQRRFGEEHGTTARAHYALGASLFDQGQREQARAELSKALEIQERVLAAGHADTLRTRAEVERQR